MNGSQDAFLMPVVSSSDTETMPLLSDEGYNFVLKEIDGEDCDMDEIFALKDMSFTLISTAEEVAVRGQEVATPAEPQPPPPADPEPQRQQSSPGTANSMPEVDSWPGVHDFSVTVKTPPAEATGRQPPYVYSESVKKLYTDVMVAVPFSFRTGGGVLPQTLRIRALPVYKDAHHRQSPVRRCATHREPEHEYNAGCEHLHHVVRAEHRDARYREDQERRSVTVPFELPEPGAAEYKVLFKFTCMNTCVGGINRRRLMIVFTLEERSSGQELGRQSIEVKVCRCPHRDWRTDEKRRQDRPQPSKKRRVCSPPPQRPPPADRPGQFLLDAGDITMYNYLKTVRDAALARDAALERRHAAAGGQAGDATPAALRRQPTAPIKPELEFQ